MAAPSRPARRWAPCRVRASRRHLDDDRVGAGFALSFALPAQAVTDTLDQSQTLTSGAEIVPWMAQTFTAGMTGQLDRVSLATNPGRPTPGTGATSRSRPG